MPLHRLGGLTLCLCITVGAFAADPGATGTASGWRGNGTGLWPESTAPIEWSRIARGAMEDMRSSAGKPAADAAGQAAPVEKGLLRHWLVIGPFALSDSVKEFESDTLGGEATAAPAAGDKVGDLAWKEASVPPDDIMVFGNAELPRLDFAKLMGFARNRVAYAHTYIHSPRGGKAIVVVDHSHGFKAWVNGEVVYRKNERHAMLANYVQVSKLELSHTTERSPRFEVTLKPGWNRMLVKVSTPAQGGHEAMHFCMRIMDPPDVKYESKNIRWMAELPARSTSTPIIVGDRIFLMAEPDELICLNKRDGKWLWSAAINPYEALPAAERAANPAFAKEVDPLVAQLRAETDREKRLKLRISIDKALTAIDEKKFAIHADGHFEAHFGIVGFTMPTPVSDGKHVYVLCGMGVAACFDLDGNRKWIKRLNTGELTYGSSPALADGVLGVFMNKLHGLDAATGEVRWTQQRVSRNVAAIQGARLAGLPVFVTQRGDVIRPSDGVLLYRLRGAEGTGDEGWSPPVVLGEVMYLPKFGVTSLVALDFTGCDADGFSPKEVHKLHTPPEVSRKADGGWIDRWTAASPLVANGFVYQIDIYQSLYVFELATQRMVIRQELPLGGLMHYNAVPVAASPTLVGKHVIVMDNQGTALVLEQGGTYKVVARNRIETQLERWWPLPGQETLAYAPPIADGDRLYLRGERYLYCIAKD